MVGYFLLEKLAIFYVNEHRRVVSRLFLLWFEMGEEFHLLEAPSSLPVVSASRPAEPPFPSEETSPASPTQFCKSVAALPAGVRAHRGIARVDNREESSSL
jgi:hypothetical protein